MCGVGRGRRGELFSGKGLGVWVLLAVLGFAGARCFCLPALSGNLLSCRFISTPLCAAALTFFAAVYRPET